MNADAARGIDVEADAGVKLGWAIWAGLGMLVVGLLMTVGCRRGRPRPPAGEP